jgi:predicted  nucleic acid-binding Zn-ribbon protein
MRINLNENKVKEVLNKILLEETSKVKREEFSRVQYKIEELENSLSETFKELRKLEDCIPSGLKTVTNGRVSGISSNLNDAQKLISQLKEKIRNYKRSLYSQQVEEKKK